MRYFIVFYIYYKGPNSFGYNSCGIKSDGYVNKKTLSENIKQDILNQGLECTNVSLTNIVEVSKEDHDDYI